MADAQRAAMKVAGTAVTLVGGGLAVLPSTVNAAGVCTATTFSQLYSAIINANAGNCTVDAIAIGAGTITFTSAGNLPAITRDVTISGASEATSIIDADGLYRIFYVTQSANTVTISDLTLQDALYVENGAGIYADGTSLTVTNVTFTGGYAGHNGGAIHWTANGNDENLTITDCTFTDNESDGMQGGAISAEPDGGLVSIIGSTFSDNINHHGGGAILVDGAALVAITDSTFTNNYAGEYGGAIYLSGTDMYVTIDGSTFENNTAVGGGGAIEAYELGSLTITDSTFTHNYANAGGAIYGPSVYGGIVITDSTFDGNHAYATSGAIRSGNDLTITGSTFSNNMSGLHGGAIYAFGSTATVVIDDTTFFENSAYYSGGALEAYNLGTVTISNSTFDGNQAYSGGAIYAWSVAEEFTITDSTFNHNSARKAGGGALWSHTTFYVSGSYFYDNTAYVDGGAIYAAGYAATATIDDSTFVHNYAHDDGGAVMAYELSTMTISGSTFNENLARDNGGAVYGTAVYDDFTITSTSFSLNETYTGSGGAVWSDSSLSISDSQFTDNTAEVDGGGLYFHGDYLNVTNSTFGGNVAGDDGGAIAFNAYETGMIRQSTLAGNSADGGFGGAIVTWSGRLHVVNSTIAKNFASQGGGGIHNSSTLALYNTIVSDDTTGAGDNDISAALRPTASGGPADVAGNYNLVEVHEVTLTGNHNIEGESADLGAFGDNGGTTETMVPNAGSPAIDAGDDTVHLGGTDQRGATRIQGDAIDIGAVETTPVPPTPPVLPATGSGTERAAWLAALLSGVGALAVGASRRRQRS